MASLLTHCKVGNHHILTQTSYTVYHGIMPWVFGQEQFSCHYFPHSIHNAAATTTIYESYLCVDSSGKCTTQTHTTTQGTSKQQQKKQHQYVMQNIATTDGNPTIEQASSQNTPQKIMGLLNSLGTDTTSVSVMYISYRENEPKTTCNTKWI